MPDKYLLNDLWGKISEGQQATIPKRGREVWMDAHCIIKWNCCIRLLLSQSLHSDLSVRFGRQQIQLVEARGKITQGMFLMFRFTPILCHSHCGCCIDALYGQLHFLCMGKKRKTSLPSPYGMMLCGLMCLIRCSLQKCVFFFSLVLPYLSTNAVFAFFWVVNMCILQSWVAKSFFAYRSLYLTKGYLQHHERFLKLRTKFI